MKTVKHGVTFTGKSTTADVENQTVTCRHLSSHASLGSQKKGNETPKFDVTWIFDMSKCSLAEIYCMAGESLVIKERRIFTKDPKPTDEAWDNATFDAKELVTRKMSRVDKAAKTLKDFTDEELAVLGLTRAKS